MEPPLSPPDPLLFGEATLTLTTTLGTMDDITGALEDLGWHWIRSRRDDMLIHHEFKMDEVYGDDADMMHDFLHDQVSEAVDKNRLADIDLGMATSRVS